MRKLLVTVCVVGIVDAMLYAVLIPLLPEITNSLNLGKSAAGFLVAAYALGALSGVIPAGLVTIRLGAKVAVILGMTLLSAASLIFASAESLDALIAARFLQGV